MPSPPPDAKCLLEGAKYLCQINRGGDGHSGVVSDEHGTVRWKYGIRTKPSGRSIRNPFNKPDFLISAPDGTNEMVIRRAAFIPSAFTILEAGESIGTIRLTSPLRNKYSISISGEELLTFRMPLFSVRFSGGSILGAHVWVIVGPSKMEWNILIKPGLDDRRLVAALSFIHGEWWNFS